MYTFLEEYLDVSWAQFRQYTDNPDEVVPHAATIEIPAIDRVWQPMFSYRAEQFSYHPRVKNAIDWIAKNKFNTVEFLRFPFSKDYSRNAKLEDMLSGAEKG